MGIAGVSGQRKDDALGMIGNLDSEPLGRTRVMRRHPLQAFQSRQYLRGIRDCCAIYGNPILSGYRLQPVENLRLSNFLAGITRAKGNE
jgi:hypothetical protein